MQIKNVKTWAVANPPPSHGGPFRVFLKPTTDNGISGYGEAYGVPFTPGKVRGLIEYIAGRHRDSALRHRWQRVRTVR